MFSNLRIGSWKSLLPYFIIAFTIFVFNILAIWDVDGLFQDDQEYFYRLFGKHIGDLKFSRNIIHAIYILDIIKIATTTSIYTARLFIILFLSLPTSFLLYYLVNNRYRLEKPTAAAVAILPFILPNELLIPTYIVGSYMLLAILFSFLAVFFILRFSEKDAFSRTDFFLASLFYFMATESSEIVATMLPVFLFPIFFYKKFWSKQFRLGIMLTLIAVVKTILVIKKPYGPVNSVKNDLPFSEIKYRILHFLDYINPFNGLYDIGILNIIIIGIILAGAVIALSDHTRLKRILSPGNPEDQPKSKYSYFAFYYLLPLGWLAFSLFPFLFFAQYMVSRNLVIPAVALIFLLVISMRVIHGLFTERKWPFAVILVLVIAAAGYNRQVNFSRYFEELKDQYGELGQTLMKYEFPENSQVVVATSNGNLTMGHGVTRRAVGVYQYILGRRDLSGQIMLEKSYYDSFQMFNNPWGKRNADIDTTKITYLFRCFNTDTAMNMRMHYALRWEDSESKESPWTIFHFDEQGKAAKFMSGIGYSAYDSAIDSLSAIGISREKILFGDIPGREDSLRLGL
jgi:hypothetical protein